MKLTAVQNYSNLPYHIILKCLQYWTGKDAMHMAKCMLHENKIH